MAIVLGTKGKSARGHTRGARWAVALAAALSVLSLAAPRAYAQVALEQFQPAPLASDGFGISRPDVLRKGTWGALLVADYAKNPLVLESERPPSTFHIVEHHLVLHAGVAVALGSRMTAFLSLPVHVLMRGDDPGTLAPKADGAGLGDVALGGRVLIAGGRFERMALSGEFTARLPTAELANGDQEYSGDQIGSYEPALVGEVHLGRFDARLRVGARLRKSVAMADLELGSGLTAGLGARVLLAQGLYLNGELYGGTTFADFARAQTSPLEALFGLKYVRHDVWVGAAAGPGFTAGYGTPDARVVFTIGYAPLEQQQAAPAPVPARDRDGDGVLDGADRCPSEREDADGFEDADGCPDADNDRDGVVDGSDRCPSEPEDTDGFEDLDGCAEPDHAVAGVRDLDDACPSEPEDMDKFEDANGCPDPDNDGDGVLDGLDACPLEPGKAEQQGCPGAVRIDTEKGQLVILERVEFAVNKDAILPVREKLLGDEASTISQNAQLKKLRVEGHTDSVGKDAKNLDLSTRRARSVARWLVQHGVAAERLEAYGCGETRPLGSNDTDDGRQQNRRVEFHIIDPAPQEPRSAEGCVSAPLQ